MAQNPTPEQLAELQEKLKNMSPEELKEFQKSQCIFCQIVQGKVQAKKVYDDNKLIAILDINPANPGHMLVIPKEHYMIMPQIPEDEIAYFFTVVKNLSQVSLRSLEAEGTNIIVANGQAAGQRAQHFMAHVIPRKEGDKVSFSLPQKPHADKELETIREKMSEQLMSKSPKKEKPIIIEKPEKQVVEAKFKEEPKASLKKAKSEEINIDDIAKMFGK